jgi:TonB family protein
VLKTLERYIEHGSREATGLASLWSSFGRDRRFTFLLTISVVVHLIFYASLIKLDSWAMLRAIANRKQPVSLVKLIEIAPPPDRLALRTAPEPIERADVNRLQFEPNSADDVHLIQRSPKPTEQRGAGGRLPSAALIEKQLRAMRGQNDREQPGRAVHQPTPPSTSSIQGNRIPQLDEAVLSQTPPTPNAPSPPAPSPKQDANATNSGSEGSAQPGTRRGSSSESSALGLEAAQGQYMAYVRAKIRNANERIMPREWIKDVLREKVSADFLLVIKRDGQILTARLARSTGYSVLDNSARQAIYTASPFEGFPQAAGNTVTFTVTIYFFTL